MLPQIEEARRWLPHTCPDCQIRVNPATKNGSPESILAQRLTPILTNLNVAKRNTNTKIQSSSSAPKLSVESGVRLFDVKIIVNPASSSFFILYKVEMGCFRV